MLTYNFDSRLPLYDSLYKNIKADILQGKLKANQKLPSKRNLAQHLKISVVTVENAYAQLILEGYIYALEKKGYFVCALEKTNACSPQMGEIKFENTKNRNAFYLDLASNSICSEKFPFTIWSKLMREVLLEHNTQLLDVVTYNGVEELRTAIAEHLYYFRGISVSANQIIVGAGTEYLYSLLIQLLGRKKTFAIESPGYKKIAQIYHFNDVECEFIDLDKYGMSISKLRESEAEIVHISPAHHYPTGIVMPIKRRQEILNWADEKNDRYIIEDDFDSEFRFVGRPIPTLQSIDKNEKVIYINTFSKSIAPSMRISYMVLPYHLIEKFNDTLNFYSCTVPSFEQYTLAKFISKGYFERHMNRMRNYYKKHRDAIIQAIKDSPFGEKVTIHEENAGLHFLLKVKTQMADSELKQKAFEKDIKLSFLSEYYLNENNNTNHILVLNYSGVDSNKIVESVKRLSELF
ncbi:MAG: PLP-dependent aminotransferase family protein [Clostridia bacterium]|nr:PLP-dependent aminotransferase family protein [Clostridia bacterium]